MCVCVYGGSYLGPCNQTAYIAYIAVSVCKSDCSLVFQMTVAGCWHTQTDCGEMPVLSPVSPVHPALLFGIHASVSATSVEPDVLYSPISHFKCDIWI